MSYKTDYEIKIHNAKDPEQIVKIVKMLGMNSFILDDNDADNIIGSSRLIGAKWYEWKKDCLKASTIYPKVAIFVSGVGETHGDFWKAKFSGGEFEISNGRVSYSNFKNRF